MNPFDYRLPAPQYSYSVCISRMRILHRTPSLTNYSPTLQKTVMKNNSVGRLCLKWHFTWNSSHRIVVAWNICENLVDSIRVHWNNNGIIISKKLNTFKKYVVHHHYEIVIFGGNHLKGIQFSTKNNNMQRPSNHIQTNVRFSQNVPPIFPEDFFNQRNSIYPIHFCEGRRIETKNGKNYTNIGRSTIRENDWSMQTICNESKQWCHDNQKLAFICFWRIRYVLTKHMVENQIRATSWEQAQRAPYNGLLQCYFNGSVSANSIMLFEYFYCCFQSENANKLNISTFHAILYFRRNCEKVILKMVKW